jgi:rRNA maturation endonuclease Nob1
MEDCGLSVLDSSSVFRGGLDFGLGGYLMPESAYAEIISEPARTTVEAAIRAGDIRIAVPKAEFLGEVRDKAGQTNDEGLSPADVDVLALALEYGAIVCCDDYAMQNVASHLGLRISKARHDGIREMVSWRYVCQGCQREYEGGGECGVCGHRVVRGRI